MPKTKDYHTMSLRFDKAYADYLDDLSYRTGLPVSALVRLAIHLAPYSDDFRHQVEEHAKRRKHNVQPVPHWKKNEKIWMSI